MPPRERLGTLARAAHTEKGPNITSRCRPFESIIVAHLAAAPSGQILRSAIDHFKEQTRCVRGTGSGDWREANSKSADSAPLLYRYPLRQVVGGSLGKTAANFCFRFQTEI